MLMYAGARHITRAHAARRTHCHRNREHPHRYFTCFTGTKYNYFSPPKSRAPTFLCGLRLSARKRDAFTPVKRCTKALKRPSIALRRFHLHTLAYVSIRAYFSIRQHTSAYARLHTSAQLRLPCRIRQHTLAYVSIRQHTSAYVSIRDHRAALPRQSPALC
jgi:hypothetical protein